MDIAIVVALLGSFALLLTVHVALAIGLLLRRPRWRGPLALVVPPLAPYWGISAKMRIRSGLWIGALALYTLARVAASF